MSESARLSRGKNGFPHFMLKEIHEQPAVLRRLIADCSGAGGAIKLPGGSFSDAPIRSISKITIAPSGPSRPAGMVGEFILQPNTQLPVAAHFPPPHSHPPPLARPPQLPNFL